MQETPGQIPGHYVSHKTQKGLQLIIFLTLWYIFYSLVFKKLLRKQKILWNKVNIL